MVMISSAGAGKTSLAEAMLFAAGAVPHLGSIAQGTTVSGLRAGRVAPTQFRQYQPPPLFLESHHHQSRRSPGALNLLGETVMALRAVDAVILVVGASSGIRSELDQSLVSRHNARLALSTVPQRIG